MHPTCPQCGSHRIELRHPSRRWFSLIGASAGAAGSGLQAWRLAMDASSKVFNLSSSGWHAIPLVALSALAGAASGAGAGAQLGQHLDQHVLDNARCRQCGHTFMLEATQAVPPSWSDDPYPE